MLNVELFKHLNDRYFTLFVKLLNKILDSGDIPEEWSVGVIVLLFKGGDKKYLDNYRGITLLSIFGKLFLGIPLNRLNQTVEEFKILKENQIAYRKSYRTSDHIFTLHTVIENTFASKKTLYLCFVDFKKAFDSVDYKILIDTLLSYGIKGKVLDVIKSLYAKGKSCVRGQDSLTNLCSCHCGVRQGCLLSPLLFTLFLNDLDSKINAVSTGVRLGDGNICTLLYDDD